MQTHIDKEVLYNSQQFVAAVLIKKEKKKERKKMPVLEERNITISLVSGHFTTRLYFSCRFNNK